MGLRIGPTARAFDPQMDKAAAGNLWMVGGGGTGTGGNGTGHAIPLAQGVYAKWTKVGWAPGTIPDDSGILILGITSVTPGAFVAIAPGPHFSGDNVICQVAGSNPANYQQCIVMPEEGSVSVWSTDPGGKVEILGAWSGF